MKQAEFAQMIDSLASRGTPFAVATVVQTQGPSLAKAGFKVVISGSGQVVFGTLGGACPESAIAAAAKQTMKTGVPKVVKVFLEEVENSVGAVLRSQSEDEIHVETNCGGTMEIYIEPYLPQQRLIIVGQGGKDEVEDYLVKLGKMLDYEVVVIDHAPVLTEQPDKLIQGADYDIADFDFSSTDSVVVLTKGERDIETLRALSKFKLRYVGMMASRRRVSEDLAKLKEVGVKEDFLSSFRSPAGADIGAVTAAEIAMAIMSEIVAGKYGREINRKSSSKDTHSQGIER